MAQPRLPTHWPPQPFGCFTHSCLFLQKPSGAEGEKTSAVNLPDFYQICAKGQGAGERNGKLSFESRMYVFCGIQNACLLSSCQQRPFCLLNYSVTGGSLGQRSRFLSFPPARTCECHRPQAMCADLEAGVGAGLQTHGIQTDTPEGQQDDPESSHMWTPHSGQQADGTQ